MTSSGGRSVFTADVITVRGSSPNSGSVSVLAGKFSALRRSREPALALEDDVQEEVVRQNALELVARAVRVRDEGAKAGEGEPA